MSDRIEIELSKQKTTLLFVADVVFIILGCLGAMNPEDFVSPIFRNPLIIRIAGISGVAFFGIGLVFITQKLLDKEPGLIINQNGIINNSNAIGIGLIEWEDITAIKKIQVISTKILIIQTNKPEKYIERAKSMILKKSMVANQKMYGSPISITSNSLKIRFEDLETLLIREFKRNK